MAKDHPLYWIGGAAFVVGVLVLSANTDDGEPRALTLSVPHATVTFASTHSEAIAMTSVPVATKVASRSTAPRKTSERIGALPSIPAGSMSIGIATLASALTAPASGGSELMRTLRAKAREVAALDLPGRAPPAISCAQVESSPPSEVLLAARPGRGPPTS